MNKRKFLNSAKLYDFAKKEISTIFDFEIIVASDFDYQMACYFILISKSKSTLYFIKAYQNKLYLLNKLKNKSKFQLAIGNFIDMFGLENYVINLSKL